MNKSTIAYQLAASVLALGTLGCGARSELLARAPAPDASRPRDAGPARDADVVDLPDVPDVPDVPDATRCGSVVARPLVFDGTRSRVTVASSPRFQPGTGDFSVEVWLTHSPEQLAAVPMMISHRPLNAFNAWFLALDTEGQLFVQIGGVNPPASSRVPPSLRDGRCHFAALSRREGFVSLFVDGVRTVRFPHAYDASSDDPSQGFWLGHDRARFDNTGWRGSLFEVRVYDRALSDDEVRSHVDGALPPATPGLVGRWILDPSPEDPQRILDRSPTGANAFLGSAPTVDPEDPAR